MAFSSPPTGANDGSDAWSVTGVLYPVLLRSSVAAVAMSGSSAPVAINALMLTQIKLHQPPSPRRDRAANATCNGERSMLTKRATPSGAPLSTKTVLMLAVFTVSVGYGVVLPLLPYLIERLLGTGDGTAAVSRSAGLLTGLCMLALFLFAPTWGRISDRFGRRSILLIGLSTIIQQFRRSPP